jgi:hypothetical protein
VTIDKLIGWSLIGIISLYLIIDYVREMIRDEED